MLRFETLQTPPEDGGVLIEPAAAQWQELIAGNSNRSNRSSIELLGIPLEELRRRTRQALFGKPAGGPVIAAGHQPAFAHPGVWAKHVVVRHMAERLGTLHLNFVVDNDAPKADELRIPIVGHDKLIAVEEIPFSQASAGAAYEGRESIDGAHLSEIDDRINEILNTWPADSMIHDYLSGLAAAETEDDFVEQHLAGRQTVDRQFEATLNERRVSQGFDGIFLADLLIHPDGFASVYNQALDEYRRQHQVRSPNRPLPDLQQENGRIETALWAYQPRQRRRRLFVKRTGDAIELFGGSEPIGRTGLGELKQDPQAVFGSFHPWVVRPRALTLTLWARLLACDLFVHGIGGAKYDRITDVILDRYYGKEPPAYVCVSATLRLLLPRHPVGQQDLREARRRVRDLNFNPDRYLSDPPHELMARRANLIDESRALRARHAANIQRRHNFQAIRQTNAEIVASSPEVKEQLGREVEEIEQQVRSNHLADSREYFYALQSRERLSMLADRLRRACDL